MQLELIDLLNHKKELEQLITESINAFELRYSNNIAIDSINIDRIRLFGREPFADVKIDVVIL